MYNCVLLINDLTDIIAGTLDCSRATYKQLGQKNPVPLSKPNDKSQYQAFQIADILKRIKDFNETLSTSVHHMVTFRNSCFEDNPYQFAEDYCSSLLIEWYTSPEKLLSIIINFVREPHLKARFLCENGTSLVRCLIEYILLIALKNLHTTSNFYHTQQANIDARIMFVEQQFQTLTSQLQLPLFNSEGIRTALLAKNTEWQQQWQEVEQAERAAFATHQAQIADIVSKNAGANRFTGTKKPTPAVDFSRALSGLVGYSSGASAPAAALTRPSVRYPSPPASFYQTPAAAASDSSYRPESPSSFSSVAAAYEGPCCKCGQQGVSRHEMSSTHRMALRVSCSCPCHD